ncbi:MAG: SDR family oxidoreductase [Planctomycetota bacterium]
MKILVTGDQGYIGSVMVPWLRSRGHQVAGMDNGLYRGCDFGDDIVPESEFPLDIRDVEVEHLHGFDAVVHLAALSNDPLGSLHPGCTYDINHHASVRLAECAKAAGVERFVYSSSCSVYGAADLSKPLDETADFAPVTPYAESKVQVEADVSRLADDSFSPTFLRNATVYGASPRLRGDLVVNNLTGWALATGLVQMKSDGTPWRPLVHVEDVCEAFTSVLEAHRDLIHNEAFNVGHDGENYQIADVAQLVTQAIPGSKIDYADGAGPDPRCYRVSFAKLQSKLPQCQMRWNVARGIGQLVTAFKRVGLAQQDLEGPRYQRVQTILRLMQAGNLDSDMRWAVSIA